MVITGKVTQRQGLRGGISVVVTGGSGETVTLSGVPKANCTDLVLGNDVEITVTASAVVEQEDAPVDLTEGEGDTGEADGYSNDE